MQKIIRRIYFFLVKLNEFRRSELARLRQCDVLLICHDNDKGLTIGGKAYSPLLDSVYEELTERGLVCQALALPGSKLGYRETTNHSIVFSRNYILFRLYNKLASFCGIKTASVYDSIIRKTNAKVILGIGLSSELCVSAKRSGVFDVELLHGMGYTLMPKVWQEGTRDTVPSALLVLDKKSERTMKPLEASGTKVVRIPHPFLKRFANVLNPFHEEWRYRFPKHEYHRVVLISLQWGYAGDHGAYECFKGLLPNGLFYEDLELLIQRRRDIFWKFRLHPVQLRGLMSQRSIAFMHSFSGKHVNVSWELPSSLPLPIVAQCCDAHLTMCSTSCYEVAALGLRSLVLCPTTRDEGPFADYFDDLMKEGYVTKHAFDVDFVERWVDGAALTDARSLDDDSAETWNDFINSLRALSSKARLSHDLP